MSSGIKKRLDYNLNWSEYFQLDTNSPSGLVRIKDWRGRPIEKYNAGSKMYYKTGVPHSWRVCFKEKLYYVHRIIWVMIYGSIDPELVIDHLDGNPFNNQLANLSLKTQKDNVRNKSRQFNNKTGITGVEKMFNGYGYYYKARCQDINGNRIQKYFSVSKFGEENAKILAVAYREEQIANLILEGADYTERHGT